MNTLKYRMCVTKIGPLHNVFKDNGVLVFFNDGAPPELAEFSIQHESSNLLDDIKKGDFMVFGNQKFIVTAVGDVANKNIRELGHVVVKFNGLDVPELPGDLSVEVKEIPTIVEGEVISVYSASHS